MKLHEIGSMLRLGRPTPSYGVRRLARCHSIDDLARFARRRLPKAIVGYLEGGSEDELTLRRNRDAFDDLEIVPRVLHDVSAVDTSRVLLGDPAPLPIVLAPVGAPRLFHHEGEMAVARAAGRAGVPYAISTLATAPIEHVAHSADGPLWFQLYVWGDRAVAHDLVALAKDVGCRALLLTVDTSVRSKRERELRAGLTLPSPNLSLRTLLEGALHPPWWWRFLTTDAIRFPNLPADVLDHPSEMPDIGRLFDGTASWDDVEWTRDAWNGPLALKGVLSEPDARRAADMGVDAIVVSNHGGRQLDHVPATIDVLAGIVSAVGDRVEVFVDSGFRRGTDIVAALALGARGVLVGRAHLYGLAAAGEAGVSHAIDILAAELRTAMALAGARTLDDLASVSIRRRSAPPS